MKTYCTYIMTNQRNTVLYTGITNHLAYRSWQHKTKQNLNSFTARYNINKLVYYSCSENVEDAITYEKQIKKFSRKRKEQLINEMNPEWSDLSSEIGIQDILEVESTASESHPPRRTTLHPTPETPPFRSQ